MVKTDDLSGLLESLVGVRKIEDEHVISADPKINASEIEKAVECETGAGEQRQGQSELGDNQQATRVVPPSGGAAAATFL